jgi:hypothetical protein
VEILNQTNSPKARQSSARAFIGVFTEWYPIRSDTTRHNLVWSIVETLASRRNRASGSFNRHANGVRGARYGFQVTADAERAARWAGG